MSSKPSDYSWPPLQRDQQPLLVIHQDLTHWDLKLSLYEVVTAGPATAVAEVVVINHHQGLADPAATVVNMYVPNHCQGPVDPSSTSKPHYLE